MRRGRNEWPHGVRQSSACLINCGNGPGALQETVERLTNTVTDQATEIDKLRHLVTSLALANTVLRTTLELSKTPEPKVAIGAATASDSDEVPDNLILFPHALLSSASRRRRGKA